MTYMFTCPACRSVVDYGCNCDEPQPWEGHDTYDAAMTRVGEMRGEPPHEA